MGAPAWTRTLLASAAMATVLACGQTREHDRYAVELEPLTLVQVVPGADADPSARIDLCFSAELDPRAIEEFDATLHSADLTFDTQQEVQLIPWRAPASPDALASERWCPGSVLSLTPASPLQPGLRYRVQLRPALLGWAGEALDTSQDGWRLDAEGELRWFHELEIAGDPGDDAPEQAPSLPPAPTLTELFAPGEVFDPDRGACGCHQRADELAFARLDLSSPATAWTELVLREAPGATDFPLVTPRRPAESYLIHKLARTREGEPLHALRGEAMPPDDPLPHADLVRLSHWIAGGAAP